MKILFITQLLPWPVRSGGRFKTCAVLKQLALQHQVHLACFHDYSGNSYKKNLSQLKQHCDLTSVTSFYRPQVTAPIKKMWMLVPTTILSHKPFIITKYFDKHLKDYVSEISKKIVFDAIYLDHDTSFQYLPYIHRHKNTKVIYDEHNVNSVAMWRNVISKKRSIFFRLLYLWDTFRFLQYEKKICRTVDRIAAISEIDKQLLLQRNANHDSIQILPLPLNTTSVIQSPKKNTVTFVGVLSWAPNRFGFQWFYKFVWPLIRDKISDAELVVIGARITDDTKAMIANDESVRYAGEVRNIKEWYLKTKVIVVPIWMGSGIRIKLLDAMAHGMAIVSTTIGAEGIIDHRSANSAGVMLADAPPEFAENVIRLLKNDSLRKRNKIKAKNYISRHYSFDNTQKIIDHLLK